MQLDLIDLMHSAILVPELRARNKVDVLVAVPVEAAVLINHNQVALLVPDSADQVAPDNDRAPVAHSVKAAQRKRITRARRRAAKRSTTCRHQLSVAQLFRVVMEILQ